MSNDSKCWLGETIMTLILFDMLLLFSQVGYATYSYKMAPL